ncbi:MAG TPA: hypothetical protein VGF45_00850 [Polyangia bacterium]
MLKISNLALGLVLVSGVVFAQPAPTPAPAPPAGPAAAPGAPPAGIDLRVPQRSNLTPQEMQQAATEYRGRIGGVVKRIETLLTEAREQRDIIRINCLTDKLVQVRASSGVSDKSFATMQEAIARGDQGSSLHEFTRITIINQNIQVLAGEAEACVGEELSYVGATRVDVEEPPGPDPNSGTPEPVAPERPPAVSPFF